jgi:hypothetical protein
LAGAVEYEISGASLIGDGYSDACLEVSSNEEKTDQISLDNALILAESAKWHQRELAARVFARYVDDRRAFDALVIMLDDPDTVVIEASTASLTIAGGRLGLVEVLKKLAIAEDNAAYHMRDELVALWLNGVPVLELCREIVSSEPAGGLSAIAGEMILELTT